MCNEKKVVDKEQKCIFRDIYVWGLYRVINLPYISVDLVAMTNFYEVFYFVLLYNHLEQ